MFVYHYLYSLKSSKSPKWYYCKVYNHFSLQFSVSIYSSLQSSDYLLFADGHSAGLHLYFLEVSCRFWEVHIHNLIHVMTCLISRHCSECKKMQRRKLWDIQNLLANCDNYYNILIRCEFLHISIHNTIFFIINLHGLNSLAISKFWSHFHESCCYLCLNSGP